MDDGLTVSVFVCCRLVFGEEPQLVLSIGLGLGLGLTLK